MPYRHAHWWVLALATLIVFAFWPSYFSPAARVTPALHAHAAAAVLTVAPIRRGTHRCALLILRGATPPDAGTQLQRLFGLTAAEAAVALGLARGLTLAEIAAAREVSPLTIRTQLKVVAEKLGCRRQAEIAALIARIEPVLGG